MYLYLSIYLLIIYLPSYLPTYLPIDLRIHLSTTYLPTLSSKVSIYACRYLFNCDRELCDILLNSSLIDSTKFRHLGLVQAIDGYNFHSIPLRTVVIRLFLSVVMSLVAAICVKAVLKAITTKLHRLHILKTQYPAQLTDSRGREVPLHKLYCIEIPTR